MLNLLRFIIDLFLVCFHQLILCYCTHKDVFKAKTCWLQNELCLFYISLLERKECVSSLKSYFYGDICERTIDNHSSDFHEVKHLNVQRIQSWLQSGHSMDL